MSGLLDAILLGAGLSVLSGLLAILLVSRFQSVFAGAETASWRAARWVAILPLLLAPAIYAVPEYRERPVIETAAPGTSVMPIAEGDFSVMGLIEAGAIQTGPSAVQLLLAIYLAGVVFAGLIAVRRHFWRRRILRESRDASRHERLILERYADALGIWSPDMRVSREAVSPFITGWKAVIVVPEGLFADRDATRFALIHELTHLRRGDERDRLVGAAMLAVFWFNWPLRQIERNLNQARELACDAECLDALGRAERKPYAAALIDMMRSAAQPVSAFGPDDRRHREMRIKAILAGKRDTGPIAARLGLVAAAAILPVACAQAALTERNIVDVPVRMVTQLAGSNHAEPVRLGNRVIDGRRVASDRAVTDASANVRVEPAVYVDVAVEPNVDVAVEPLLRGVQPDAPEVAPVVTADPRPTAEPAPEPQVAAGGEPVRVAAPEPRVSAAAPRIARAIAPVVSDNIDARVEAHNAVAPQDVDVSLSHNIAATVPNFSHRVTDGRVTSHFGHRPSRPAGAPVQHGGTDIAAPLGTPVWSSAPGRVVHAEMGINGNERWGNTVIIDHGDGWTTTYAHMERIDVEVGQRIRAGDAIGTVGSTGASTGPHVHLELRLNDERIDPANFIPELR